MKFAFNLKSLAAVFAGVIAVSALSGCNQATDVSPNVSEADMKAANQRQAQSVSERTDLTPEQRAGLANHYGGGAPKGAPGSGPPPVPTPTGGG